MGETAQHLAMQDIVVLDSRATMSSENSCLYHQWWTSGTYRVRQHPLFRTCTCIYKLWNIFTQHLFHFDEALEKGNFTLNLGTMKHTIGHMTTDRVISKPFSFSLGNTCKMQRVTCK